MPNQLRYDPTAAHRLLDPQQIASLEPDLTAARDEVLHDVELLSAGQDVPPEKRPLDAGFIHFPENLLTDRQEQGSESLLGRIEATASALRDELDRIVLLGIGGSYMGARALFEALCHPYHNELSRSDRGGIPRLYFAGNNLDNDVMRSLLELLHRQCDDPADVARRWGTVVISKSGGTLETAVAFRLVREALESYYGPDSEASRRYVVPVTGEAGKLRALADAKEYPQTFPIPDGVGGRFSVLTAVGLLPAALLGLDLTKLLQGAVDMTRRFREAVPGENPVLDYTATCHLLEKHHGMNIRVLSTWGARLEALGFWYDQLLSESLGKQERGATPLTVVNTRDLHSRGQQHQEGTRDKLITNLLVEQPSSEPLPLPQHTGDEDQLNRYAGTSMPEFLSAALRGTNRAYAEAERPTADLILPRLDEHALGQVLQMFMLATVLEGRLIGINPYGQPGVEAYKTNMTAILSGG